MSIPAPHPDRTALVTGASSGIGRELARLLAARGHGVTLVARRADALTELAGELSSAHGVRAEVVPTDLTDLDARVALVDAVAERGLAVNVLVNNAGFSTVGPVHRSDPAREVAMVRTDVEAVVHLCALLTPGMADRRSGSVLNVASTAAFQPIPGQAGYGASKAFVLSYSHALRAELRPMGVSVTALCPGPVETGFVAAAGMDETEAANAMPRAMWVPAERVARAGIEGMDRNRAVVIPGAANRVTAGAAWMTPRGVLVPLLARAHPGLRRRD